MAVRSAFESELLRKLAKRIDHSDRAQLLSRLEIFAQQPLAATPLSGGHDQRVPVGDLRRIYPVPSTLNQRIGRIYRLPLSKELDHRPSVRP